MTVIAYPTKQPNSSLTVKTFDAPEEKKKTNPLENFVGQGDNVGNRLFPPFPCIFFSYESLTLYHIPDFKRQWEKAFENIVGKRENAGNQDFLLFA